MIIKPKDMFGVCENLTLLKKWEFVNYKKFVKINQMIETLSVSVSLYARSPLPYSNHLLTARFLKEKEIKVYFS